MHPSVRSDQEPVIDITSKLETFNAANRTVLMDGTCGTREVKVKRVPNSELDDDFRASILDHRMLCHHPNIVTIYSVVYDNIHCHVALEKCPFNLEQYVAANPTLMSYPDAEPLHIFRGIVEGLRHLDANKKCHGNLNARHVLIKPGRTWYLPPTPILCSLRTRGKDGKAIDMQALAKLILHCLTYHKQYDNLPIGNEDAVFLYKWADLKNENGVAYDLIGLLLQNFDRLDYSEVSDQEPVIHITSKLETFNAANRTVLMDGTCGTREVKVKRVPNSELDDDFRASILDHRMLCDHPNIVTVYSVVYDNTHCHVALEKCPFNLEQYVAANPTLMSYPDSEPLHIFRGIVEGLMHLDANQKCHGNLNARHVLIKPGGSWYLRPTPILCSLRTRGKDGKAIDMQALAKLILQCLTYHKQYDNLPIGNEDAVFLYKWADLKNENGVAYDLIGLLLQNFDRLDYSEVYLHPFFLTWAQPSSGSGWMSLIDNDWKKDMMEGPKSSMYLEDTPGLLQLIRNTSHQIRELTHFRGRDRRWLEKHISSTFPSLFRDVYNKGKEHTGCAYDMNLSRYYTGEILM
ncbi:RNA-directed DNA polymerase, eukaryota [Tanacetum coccineum]